MQEAGALYGVQCAATAAQALGLTAATARHTAVFDDFHAAMLSSATANTVHVSAAYPEVVGMWPGMKESEAATCCA